tara:strand:- start:5850 stop:6515 length:666 start_codon:yes stop_codon:yes gene_type:complete
MRIKYSLFCLGFWLSLACNSYAENPVIWNGDNSYRYDLTEYDKPREELRGLRIERKFDYSFDERQRKKFLYLEGSFYSQSGQNSYTYNERMVASTVQKSSELFMRYLDDLGLYYNQCLAVKNLDIYYISKSVMADSRRFNQNPSANKETQKVGHVLWALYDPMPQSESSVIYITDRGSYSEEMLAHEVSHYWFDRLCIYRETTVDTETFAQKFQKYYMKNR